MKKNNESTPCEPHPDIHCVACGKKYEYNNSLMGYNCILIIDQRNTPPTIFFAWCDHYCLRQWLDTVVAKQK
jgi:hypothetical protein